MTPPWCPSCRYAWPRPHPAVCADCGRDLPLTPLVRAPRRAWLLTDDDVSFLRVLRIRSE